MGSAGSDDLTLSPGDVYNPHRRFDIAKKIRACSRLSLGAKLAWEALQDRTNAKQGFCFPAYDTIAEDLGVSRDQAKRYVKELEEAGHVRIKPVWEQSGRQTSNVFEFLYCDLEELKESGAKLTRGRGVRLPPRTGASKNSPGSSDLPPKPTNKEPGQKELNQHQPPKSLMPPPTPSRDTAGHRAQIDVDQGSISSPEDDEHFNSPLEELVHLCRRRGHLLSATAWRRISELLELRNVDLPSFANEARRHLTNPRIHNPVGFLTSLARNFHSMTREVTVRPVPAPTSKHDICSICKSPRGRGVVITEANKLAPCECATSEYVSEFRTKEAAREERIKSDKADRVRESRPVDAG